MLDQPVKKLVLLLESPEERPEIPDEEPKELFSEWRSWYTEHLAYLSTLNDLEKKSVWVEMMNI